MRGIGLLGLDSIVTGNGDTLESYYIVHLVPSPSETWFRGMSVGGSFRRE